MRRKDLKREIIKHIQYWRPVLDLQNWTIKVNWSSDKDVASCLADPTYKTMNLKFNLKKIAKEVDDLEELALHELVHGPLWLLARGLENRSRTKVIAHIEENTTCTFTSALLSARALGERRAKRRK